MKSTLTLILFSLILSLNVKGQFSETIQSSRPGQAFVPYTTGKNVFQVQSGLNALQTESAAANDSDLSMAYSGLFRFGIGEKLELRSSLVFADQHTQLTNSSESHLSGISAWSVGARYNILSGGGTQPALGIQAGFALPYIGNDYRPVDLAPQVMLMHSQKLTDLFQLTTNWGVDWATNANNAKGQYVINIAFPLGEKWGGFIENYGDLYRGDFDTRWDTGVGFLVNKDFQLDASVGAGVNEGIFDWFVDAGLSWRIQFE